MWPFTKRKPPEVDLSKISELLPDHSLTPDFRKMDQSGYHLLFVYCDLQKGMRRHDLLDGHCRFDKPYEAFTAKKNFQMFVRRMGRHSYPVALRARNDYNALTGFTQTTYDPGTIRGELYVVKSSQMIELDKLKFNGYIFDRLRVHVRTEYASGFTPVKDERMTGYFRERQHVLEASMYVGRRDYWDNLVDGGVFYAPGRTGQSSNPMINRYYYFDETDLNDKVVKYPRSK